MPLCQLINFINHPHLLRRRQGNSSNSPSIESEAWTNLEIILVLLSPACLVVIIAVSRRNRGAKQPRLVGRSRLPHLLATLLPARPTCDTAHFTLFAGPVSRRVELSSTGMTDLTRINGFQWLLDNHVLVNDNAAAALCNPTTSYRYDTHLPRNSLSVLLHH
ncbi:hypothetical protein GE09DRAFT_726272 [Coniochaeta sp. 2T2.1]|nr:hypothetical protein GE09DRAFT_726272 [Coniochaeta sp. 2T2.1]